MNACFSDNRHIPFMQLNTLYQLYAATRRGSSVLDMADTLLLMPDLMNCGRAVRTDRLKTLWRNYGRKSLE